MPGRRRDTVRVRVTLELTRGISHGTLAETRELSRRVLRWVQVYCPYPVKIVKISYRKPKCKTQDSPKHSAAKGSAT